MDEAIKTKTVTEIPQEKYGTVYLPPVPVSVLKSLSKGKGDDITLSDVLVRCLHVIYSCKWYSGFFLNPFPHTSSLLLCNR